MYICIIYLYLGICKCNNTYPTLFIDMTGQAGCIAQEVSVPSSVFDPR